MIQQYSLVTKIPKMMARSLFPPSSSVGERQRKRKGEREREGGTSLMVPDAFQGLD